VDDLDVGMIVLSPYHVSKKLASIEFQLRTRPAIYQPLHLSVRLNVKHLDVQTINEG